MDWLKFEFNYRLDVERLITHITAVEAQKEAARNRVLPPQWRENSGGESAASAQDEAPPHQCNTVRAHMWVRQRFVPGSALLSLDDILKMHRMAAEESNVSYNAGALRQLPVQVGRREVGGIHMGAPASRLPQLMSQFVDFISSEKLLRLPATVHALVAHFFFTTIHPFGDGNGRVSRLVAAAVLFQRGYNGHGFYGLSNHFYQNAIRYHSLLHQCWQQPLPFDLTEFVAFGMEGLASELQWIGSFIKVKLHRGVAREAADSAVRIARAQRRSNRQQRAEALFVQDIGSRVRVPTDCAPGSGTSLAARPHTRFKTDLRCV